MVGYNVTVTRQVLFVAILTIIAGGPAPASLGAAKRIRFVDPTVKDVYFPVEVNNWWGAMNQNGNLAIYPQYDWTDHGYDGWVRIVVDGKTGYVRGATRGKRDPDNSHSIIKPQFDYGDRFQEKFAAVGNEGRYGFIHVSGRPHTELKYDAVLRFKEGMAAVQIEDRCGFIDKSGKVAIELRYARVRSFHENLAMVQLRGAEPEQGVLGYINRTGKFTWPDDKKSFKDLGDFHSGLARAQTGSKWGYINKTGRPSIRPEYDEARDFHNGLAAVRLGEKWGYITKAGRWAIKPHFDQADDFDETLAMVMLDGRYGYVDKTGRLRIKTEFAQARPFLSRYARVSVESGFGYVDSAGHIVWDPRQALQGFIDITTWPRAVASGVTTQQQAVSRTGRKSELIDPPAPRQPLPPPYPPDHEYVEELAEPLAHEEAENLIR